MHLVCRLSCQKSERIPLVAARCVLSERAAERTPESRILWLSAFVPAHKDSIMVRKLLGYVKVILNFRLYLFDKQEIGI